MVLTMATTPVLFSVLHNLLSGRRTANNALRCRPLSLMVSADGDLLNRPLFEANTLCYLDVLSDHLEDDDCRCRALFLCVPVIHALPMSRLVVASVKRLQILELNAPNDQRLSGWLMHLLWHSGTLTRLCLQMTINNRGIDQELQQVFNPPERHTDTPSHLRDVTLEWRVLYAVTVQTISSVMQFARTHLPELQRLTVCFRGRIVGFMRPNISDGVKEGTRLRHLCFEIPHTCVSAELLCDVLRCFADAPLESLTINASRNDMSSTFWKHFVELVSRWSSTLRRLRLELAGNRCGPAPPTFYAMLQHAVIVIVGNRLLLFLTTVMCAEPIKYFSTVSKG